MIRSYMEAPFNPVHFTPEEALTDEESRILRREPDEFSRQVLETAAIEARLRLAELQREADGKAADLFRYLEMLGDQAEEARARLKEKFGAYTPEKHDQIVEYLKTHYFNPNGAG